MRKSKIGLVAISAMLFSLVFPINNYAQAEDCPTYDLVKTFDQEFYPNLKWDTSSGTKTIKWSTNATIVNNVPVASQFTSEEDSWLVDSINAWDMTLDKIQFQRVTDPNQADVVIGLTALQNDGYWTIAKSETNPNIRVKGTIQISTTTPVKLGKVGFITVALSEIGNLLGLGDIQHAGTPHSVMFDPDQPPFGVLPLEDFDIDMMRQFYGESTCHSAWSPELKKAKADYVAAQEKAKSDAQAAADAKALADAQAEADRIAAEKKAQEDAIRASLGSSKKTTITCIKGKTIKKVSAVKPKCPAGYKKK